MRRRRGAFARLAVAWALAASASPAVRTDDGAPRARNATAAAASLGASFHVELADGRLSASVATLLPAGHLRSEEPQQKVGGLRAIAN